MAHLFSDGFDIYGAAADLTTAGPWQSNSGSAAPSSTTRFSLGKALSITAVSGSLAQNAWAAGSSTNTVFLSLGLVATSLTGAAYLNTLGEYITLRNNGTAVVTIFFDLAGGSIVVLRGTQAGTVIATYSGALTATVWAHFQFKIVLDATAGSVEIRKNGNTSNDFSATGLNTSAGTNTVNGLIIATGASTGSTSSLIDDLHINDSSGTVDNTWPGDIRCYTGFANADTTQKDFVAAAPPASTVTTVISTSSAAANQARGTRMTAAYTGQLNSCTVNLSAGITGNCRVYLYTDNGSSGPGTLLASSATVTNPSSGNVSFSFPTPSSVTKNTLYHLVFVSDAAIASIPIAGAPTGSLFAAGTVTPSSAPNNPATTSTSNAGLVMTATYAFTANANALNENPNDGDTTYVSSATVGALDLYDFDDLPATPASILGVQVRAIARKSDAGTRAAQLAVKSGTTQVLGTSTNLSTSYTALIQMWTTDPATGAAWTASAVNALKIGQKVSV